jgi:hypothetical protein
VVQHQNASPVMLESMQLIKTLLLALSVLRVSSQPLPPTTVLHVLWVSTKYPQGKLSVWTAVLADTAHKLGMWIAATVDPTVILPSDLRFVTVAGKVTTILQSKKGTPVVSCAHP